MKWQSRARRLLRTAMSGIAATAVDMTAMVLLVELARCPIGAAAFLSACAGALVNFTINKYWAFRCPAPVEPRQLLVFALVALGTSTCVAMLVSGLTHGVGIPYLASKIVAAILVFLTWTYPAQSRLVFPHSSS
jgi:putative flippase GtrA